MQNKIQTIQIGKLFDRISELENHTFEYEKEYKPKTKFKFKGSDGEFKEIFSMIKKKDVIFEVELNDGHKFTAGGSHYVKTNKGLVQTLKLNTTDFKILVNDIPFDIINITELGTNDVFDVTIDSPDHLYKDAKGITHHNTYNITKTIKDAGLKEIEPIDVPDDVELEDLVDADIDIAQQTDGDWVHLKGSTTAFGMVINLYKYRNKLLVFDDCDAVFTDKNAVNVLKTALDSSDKRIITWATGATMKKATKKSGPPPIPPRFQFNGSIIFISNWSLKQIDSAVRNRSFVVDIALKQQDILKRIKTIMPFIGKDMEVPLSQQAKERAFEFLCEAAENPKNQMEISIRTLVNFAKIAQSGVSQWKRLMQIQALNI